MIDTPEKLKLPSLNGEEVEVRTCWTKGAGTQYLQLIMGDKVAVIPRESFIRAAMLLGDELEQESLIPTRKVTMRTFNKRVSVQLRRRMEEGEILTIPVTMTVPVTEEQAQGAKFI